MNVDASCSLRACLRGQTRRKDGVIAYFGIMLACAVIPIIHTTCRLNMLTQSLPALTSFRTACRFLLRWLREVFKVASF